jgi:hypothetical protein
MISIGIGFGIAFSAIESLTVMAKKAWMAISNIGTVYDHQGFGWKDTFKMWCKNLAITEKAAVIANLQWFSKNLNKAGNKLADASDILKNAVMAVHDEALAITRMHADLVNASEKIQVLKTF